MTPKDCIPAKVGQVVAEFLSGPDELSRFRFVLYRLDTFPIYEFQPKMNGGYMRVQHFNAVPESYEGYAEWVKVVRKETYDARTALMVRCGKLPEPREGERP